MPVKVVDVELDDPRKAPEVGEHTEDVLVSVLGYDDATIATKRSAGAFGSGAPAPRDGLG